jgi:hypothetical protein
MRDASVTDFAASGAVPDIGVTEIVHRLGASPATFYRYIPAANREYLRRLRTPALTAESRTPQAGSGVSLSVGNGWIPVFRRDRRQRRGCADSSRSLSHYRTAGVDPFRTFGPAH